MVRRIGDPVVVDKHGSYVIAQRGSMLDDETLYLIRTAEEDGELKIDSLTPYYDAGQAEAARRTTTLSEWRPRPSLSICKVCPDPRQCARLSRRQCVMTAIR
ncbi:MAG: hypothetical protein WCA82_05560 [Jiangellales bacterium]